MARPQQIFVVGLDEYNLSELKTIRQADDCVFHELLSMDEVKRPHRFDIDHLLRTAEGRLDAAERVDAIIGFWDFPVSLLVPLLHERYGTVGPSLESALKCEHKYWSRLEQRRWVGPHVPAVNAVDPFAADPAGMIDLPYPFWLKPVKAHSSQLGFRVDTDDQLNRAIEAIREGIGRFAAPFNVFLSHVDPPPEVAGVDGHWCIAEEILCGEQCTQSGYVADGNIHTYGLIDSLYYDAAPSFFRYRYPSRVPRDLERRMAEISTNIIARIGFDNSPFNIEYLYDRARDRIDLLEINTRISQSHADLYAKVDGASNHQVLVDIATGGQPEPPAAGGRFRLASKFQHRVFRDGIVRRVPSDEDIESVRKAFPDTVVLVEVEPGQRLSALEGQDAYSFRLAVIYMGAEDDETLLENYRRCIRMLNFQIEETAA